MKRKRRVTKFQSVSKPATLAKQARIRAMLAGAQDGFTVKELATTLGMSRQLCLYHLKKMVADYQLTMVLEPCLVNNGLQFRIWDAVQVAIHFSRQLELRIAA
jgi:hypothetical protein